MSAKIITIAIEKGGTGKTVTASNLAYLMGDEGKKVLCVDTDPQGNLTKALSGGLSITSDEFYGKALYIFSMGSCIIARRETLLWKRSMKMWI